MPLKIGPHLAYHFRSAMSPPTHAYVAALLCISLFGIARPAQADSQSPPDPSAPAPAMLGQVSATGGYSTSIQLDLPAPRGDLGVPIGVVYQGNTAIGEAGIGWAVPVAYLRQSSTISERKPRYFGGQPTEVAVRTSVDLGGGPLLLSQAPDGNFRALTDGSIEARQVDADTWRVLDGSGHVYVFSKLPALDEKSYWALTLISDRTGQNSIRLTYAVKDVVFPQSLGGVGAHELLLTDASYSFNDSNCAKYHVQLTYRPAHDLVSPIPAGKLLAYGVVAGQPRAHTQLLESIVTWMSGDAACEIQTRARTTRFSYGVAPETGQPLLVSADAWGYGDPATNSASSRPVGRFSYGSPLTDGKLIYGLAQQAPLPSNSYGDAPEDALTASFVFPAGHAADHEFLEVVRDLTGDSRADFAYEPERIGAFPPLQLASRQPTADGSLAFRASIDLWDAVSGDLGHYLELFRLSHEPVNSTSTNRMLLDWNGDGRVDVVFRDEWPTTWHVRLNLPGATEGTIAWKAMDVDVSDVTREMQHFLQMADSDQWVHFSLERRSRYAGSSGSGSDEMVTQWTLMDVNGDSLPDFVFAGGTDGSYAREVRVMYNHGGTSPFHGTSVRLRATLCGVERTREYAASNATPGTKTSFLSCGLVDVNGDGLMDYVDEYNQRPALNPAASVPPGPMRVYLGTGLPDDFQDSRSFVLPAPLGVSQTGADNTCENAELVRTYQLSQLVDLTGDGVPDFVYQGAADLIDGGIPVAGVPHGTDHVTWVMPGTGAGFAAAVRLEVRDVDLAGAPYTHALPLWDSVQACNFSHYDFSGDTRVHHAFADLDGDGRPEALGAIWDKLSWSSITSSSGPGALDSGRLVEISNGYGASTRITWGNAKNELATRHELPSPEIVVTSVSATATKGLGPSLAPIRYAYGAPMRDFSPLSDRWRFVGYGRVATLTGLDVKRGQVEGTLQISDQLAPNELGRSLARAALAGRSKETVTLAGRFLTDPTSLLAIDTSSDARLESGTVTRWELVDNVVKMTSYDPDFDCLGYDGSFFELGEPGDVILPGSHPPSWGPDVCRSQVIPYVKEQSSWEGSAKPAFATASSTAIQTYSSVRKIDSLGRVTLLEDRRDVSTDTDDVCTHYEYATSSRTDLLVLDALASWHISDCKSDDPIAGARFRYDHQPEGAALEGLVTDVIQEKYQGGQAVEAHTTTSIGYDRFGNVSVTESNVWGPDSLPRARLSKTERDDSFSIAVTSESSWGTDVPALTTTVERDPVTLAPLAIHDPDGAIYKHTFDGFGRVRRSSVVLGSGPEYLLSEATYGDDPSNPSGRTLELKAFDDLTTTSTPNPSGTRVVMFYDELGRTTFVQSSLGSDYGDRILDSQYVLRDALGRVVFHAAPFQAASLANLDVGTLYGTTYQYNPDGRLRCSIDGVGPQSDPTTAPAADRYATCFSISYAGGTQMSQRRGPNENLAGDARYGAYDEVRHSATGQLLARRRAKDATLLERAELGYDRLGNLTKIRRYPQPSTSTDVTTWAFTFDSLGRPVTSDEPGEAPKKYRYDSEGNLVEVTWDVPGGTKGYTIQHDAFGRMTRQTEMANGAEVDGTAATFHYDVASSSSEHVSPTNLLGRMSWAENKSARTYFGYDLMGNTTSIARVNTADTATWPFVEGRSYSPQGQLDTLIFDIPQEEQGGGISRETVQYVYDSAHRVRSVDFILPGGYSRSLFDATQIDDLGRYTAVQYGNGVMSAWSYRGDRRRELQSISLTAHNGLRFRTLDAPDGEGRVPRRTETSLTNGQYRYVDTTYQYDVLNRLQRATERDTTPMPSVLQFDQEYGYDPLGNLTRVDDHVRPAGNLALSMDAHDRDRVCQAWNPTTESTPIACDHLYDEQGNAIATDNADAIARQMSYDAFGDVLTITRGTATARFSYDAFGDIAALDIAGSNQDDNRHDLHYGDLIEKALFRKDGSWVQIVERKIPGPMGIIARKRGEGVIAAMIYEHDDTNGGRYFTDENGNIVQDVEYDAYGNVLLDSGNFGDIRYTKELWNSGDTLKDFGLTQLGPRLYDPRLRRFLQRDPLVVVSGAQRMNPYAFGFNDPINNSDSSGLYPDEGDGGSDEPDIDIAATPQDAARGFAGYRKVGDYWYGITTNNRMCIGDCRLSITASQLDALRNAGSSGPVPSKVPIAVTVQNMRTLARVSDAAGSWVTGAVGGFMKGFEGAIDGVLTTAFHPLETVEGIFSMVRHPIDTAEALTSSAIDFAKAVADGDSEAIGELSFGAVAFLAAGPLQRAIAEVAEIGEAGELGAMAERPQASLHTPCGHCFVAGTMVDTETGYLPIEMVSEGMLVYSRSEATGEESFRPVLRVFQPPAQPTVDVIASDGRGGSERIAVTYDHPFYTARGWVRAANLAATDVLFTERAGWVPVISVEARDRAVPVYNFEVGEDHTYFVGELGIWVHNAPCNVGRGGAQARLRQLGEDTKASSADRGWIKQEQNQIARGTRGEVRNPPGKQLAHSRGREAAKGYNHMESPSQLQDTDLHRLQHKHDNFGRKNPERK
jgi:RHS repeat-associated protein